MTYTIDDTIQNIIFNGNDVQRLIYNGSLVWEKGADNPYAGMYLTMKIISNTVTMKWVCQNAGKTAKISYRKNGGSWTQIIPTTSGAVISVTKDDIIEFKGTNNQYQVGSGTYYRNYFSITGGSVEVYGNAMSLIYGDDFIGKTTFPSNSLRNFAYLFYNSTSIISAQNLVLPVTTLTERCYTYMFSGCKYLVTPPNLPATTLAARCYANLFSSCSALTTAPNLPATTLAARCYANLFSSCSALTTAPNLPATTLADGCYNQMFNRCSSLVNVPTTLPATTLYISCYDSMFMNCSSLTTAPALPATTLEQRCYSNMFDGCSSLVNAPALPAMTMKSYCYAEMFSGCSSLITAPVLPATTLGSSTNCYVSMFYNCTALRYLKALWTDNPGTNTNNWVYGCSNTSDFIFVKNSAATWTQTGSNAVLSNWTIQYASS